ncbi:MAG: 4Fe-4S dicluster domain-containing protein [Elusimicrobiota bacterium]
MKYHVLEKEQLDCFIKSLAKKMKVVAPVSKGHGNYAFEEVKEAKEIAVDYIPTILPPKKYFMPAREKMLDFDLSGKEPKESASLEIEEMAIFGVHTCDLAGIQCLNIVFNERPRDYNYLLRKEKLFIIGLECNKYCDEFAGCALVNSHLPNGGYDLFFTDIGDKYLVNVNTQKGEDFVESIGLPKADAKELAEIEKIREEKKKVFKNEVEVEPKKIPEMFEKVYNSKLWEKVGEKCVSCGNCTNVCPTCYCFDMEDFINLDLKTGARIRSWDSCQFETFATVAGGENFREERSMRQRHRVYRKFKFPVDKFNRFFCTGCGRCSRTCMAGINLKEILKEVAEESKF